MNEAHRIDEKEMYIEEDLIPTRKLAVLHLDSAGSGPLNTTKLLDKTCLYLVFGDCSYLALPSKNVVSSRPI